MNTRRLADRIEQVRIIVRVTPELGCRIKVGPDEKILFPPISFLPDIVDFGGDDVTQLRHSPLESLAIAELAFLPVGILGIGASKVGLNLEPCTRRLD